MKVDMKLGSEEDQERGKKRGLVEYGEGYAQNTLWTWIKKINFPIKQVNSSAYTNTSTFLTRIFCTIDENMR